VTQKTGISATELAQILGVPRFLIYKLAHKGRVTHALCVAGNGRYRHWRFAPTSRLVPSSRRRPGAKYAHAYDLD
jgi:hypothetical protein